VSEAAAAAAAPWALIDARAESGASTSASTRLAGLSLLARHLRAIARLGWAGAEVLVAGADDRAAVDAALARDGTPPGLTVRMIGAGERPQPGAVPLALRAVYTGDALDAAGRAGHAPEPLASARTEAELATAQARLEAGLRKTIAHDGVVAYYVMRPLSLRMARALLETRVTPNQVTMVALICGVTGGLISGAGGYTATALAALLVWAGAVIDCVDGDLARLRLQGSRLGQWLDTLADDLTTFALLAGLGVGLYRDGAGPEWLALGLGGAVVWAFTEGKIYVGLHRLGLPIDTARYPWFFGDPSAGPGKSAGFLGRALYLVLFLFKRDAFITLIALALLLDQRRVATAGLALGSGVTFVLLLLHLALTSARKPERKPAV
jgi:hypothetical protein